MSKRPYLPPERQIQSVSLEQMMPLILERLSVGGTVEFSPHGISMLPLLREGRDSVILASPPKALKKYDIPLYRRADGSYVLHRVTEVASGTYTCIGDNQYHPERGVMDDEILAVAVAIRRGKRYLPVTSLSLALYARWIHATRGPRYFLFRVRRKLCRILGIRHKSKAFGDTSPKRRS